MDWGAVEELIDRLQLSKGRAPSRWCDRSQ